MPRSAALGFVAIALVCAADLERVAPPNQRTIWRDPGNIEALDLGRGPGHALPHPPYDFIEEDTSGTSPKLKLRDAQGRVWRVKFGPETSADVFGSRIAWACGYFAETSYFVRFGHVQGVRNPQRIAGHLKDGHFRNARFALSDEAVKPVASERWTWNENPFANTRELHGLKILVMLLSNWDNKDGRDASRGSNTMVLETVAGGRREWRYALTDWGASMGKWGGFVSREKWNCAEYLRQTPFFVTGVRDGGFIEWGFKGQHTESFAKDIHVEDVRWLMQRLGHLTDAQIRAALEASGATVREQECFTAALRQRIARLAAL